VSAAAVIIIIDNMVATLGGLKARILASEEVIDYESIEDSLGAAQAIINQVAE